MAPISLLALVLGLLMTSSAWADRITLTTPVVVDPPQAQRIDIKQDWVVNPETKTLIIPYEIQDTTGTPIRDANTFNSIHRFVCQNIPAPYPDNLHCTGPGTPDSCCTASMTGTCNVPVSTCFSDIFGRAIACPADAGKTLGGGLKALILNEMKQAGVVFPGGFNGTFDAP